MARPAKRQARGLLQVTAAQKLSLREKMDPDTINRQMDAAKARWDKSVCLPTLRLPCGPSMMFLHEPSLSKILHA